MRQGQQNRRGRGRNNNNRKGHNPLTRSFESNGPDVKIRGTPAHIAEKYMSLARDAQASGDPVLAENYLQHAEHYNRIIMAFREQHMQQTGEMMNGAPGRNRPMGEEGGEIGEFDGEDDGEEMLADSTGQPIRGHEPQPRFEGQPRQGDGRQGDRPHRNNDHNNRDNRDHNRDHNRQGRDRFGGRPNFRNNRPEQGERGDRGERLPTPEASSFGGDAQPPAIGGEGQQPAPRRRERFQQPQATPGHDQPEFLRRSVRRPRREAADDVEGGAEPNGAGHGDDKTN